jgi:hypothetical protein
MTIATVCAYVQSQVFATYQVPMFRFQASKERPLHLLTITPFCLLNGSNTRWIRAYPATVAGVKGKRLHE